MFKPLFYLIVAMAFFTSTASASDRVIQVGKISSVTPYPTDQGARSFVVTERGQLMVLGTVSFVEGDSAEVRINYEAYNALCITSELGDICLEIILSYGEIPVSY